MSISVGLLDLGGGAALVFLNFIFALSMSVSSHSDDPEQNSEYVDQVGP